MTNSSLRRKLDKNMIVAAMPALTVLKSNLYSIRSGCDKKLHISNMSRKHPWPHVMGNRNLTLITVSEI